LLFVLLFVSTLIFIVGRTDATFSINDNTALFLLARLILNVIKDVFILWLMPVTVLLVIGILLESEDK